jgi:hypothetical protein
MKAMFILITYCLNFFRKHFLEIIDMLGWTRTHAIRRYNNPHQINSSGFPTENNRPMLRRRRFGSHVHFSTRYRTPFVPYPTHSASQLYQRSATIRNLYRHPTIFPDPNRLILRRTIYQLRLPLRNLIVITRSIECNPTRGIGSIRN